VGIVEYGTLSKVGWLGKRALDKVVKASLLAADKESKPKRKTIVDLTSNPELQALFREEVGERALALATGARAMATAPLAPSEITDVRRDAHTIKGNSLVMGFPHMAAAAKSIEDFFRDVENEIYPQDSTAARLIAAIADAFPGAIDEELSGEPIVLNDAATAFRNHIEGSDPDGPDSGTAPKQSSESDLAGGFSEQPDVHDADEISGNADTVVPLLTPAKASPKSQDLGGLISSLGSNLDGESTRVDTARLYQLINRVVEVRLDSAAIRRGLEGLRDDAQTGGVVPQLLQKWAGDLEFLVSSIEHSVGSLQAEALDLASVPLSDATNSFDQLVKFLVRRTGKEVRFDLSGDSLEIDRQVVEALREPLRHLVVNAVDHGIEMPSVRAEAGKLATGLVSLSAELADNVLRVTIRDDGAGVAWDAISEDDEAATHEDLVRKLMAPNVSSLPEPGEISGGGEGLFVVDQAVRQLGGTVTIDSNTQGTTVVVTVPASLSLQEVLIVQTGTQKWGIPEVAVVGVVPANADLVDDSVRFEDELVPAYAFGAAVGVDEEADVTQAIVLETKGGRLALLVGSQIEIREVAVKQLGPMLVGSPHLAGAAILGGDNVVVIVAPDELAKRVMSHPVDLFVERPRVLVVDDSLGVRQLLGASLSSSGFDISTASSAMAAREELAKSSFDALVVDFSMPGHDGVELVSVVRAEAPNLPIVMVSGVAEPADQSRAFAAGVDAFLDKSDFREGVLATTLWALVHAEAEIAQ